MGYVYMLECSDGKFYVGTTRHLHARLGQHQRGEAASFTRRRRPVALIWHQEFDSMAEAYVVEHQIKGWSRKKKRALADRGSPMQWVPQDALVQQGKRDWVPRALQRREGWRES